MIRTLGHKLFRLLRWFFLLALFLAAAVGLYTLHEGYALYTQALEESPIVETMAAIEQKPHYTKLEELPPLYLDAVVAAEDHRFYQHHGVDGIAILRAVWHDIQAGRMVEGGSTITQQLAKNQFFTQKKELTRKIAEVFMAREIERLYDKDHILELYINSIYYGDGYYCIYDASMGYLGKTPAELSDSECALLAGLPNAPSVYAPTANPDLARQRQHQVLRNMVLWGYLSEEEAAALAL